MLMHIFLLDFESGHQTFIECLGLIAPFSERCRLKTLDLLTRTWRGMFHYFLFACLISILTLDRHPDVQGWLRGEIVVVVDLPWVLDLSLLRCECLVQQDVIIDDLKFGLAHYYLQFIILNNEQLKTRRGKLCQFQYAQTQFLEF